MSQTGNRRFMNWSNVTFTPNGGQALAINGVQSVKIDAGGSLAKFAGDGDRYNSTVVNDFNEPTVEVEAGDVAALQSIPIGSEGTVTATLEDAKNGTGAGAITYTLSNAVCSKNSTTGKHRSYGMGTISFDLYAPDGITNPIATSVAT